MPSEFSPPSRGTARVTKKQLKQIQENYAKAEALAQDFSEKEAKEKQKEVAKLEQELDILFEENTSSTSHEKPRIHIIIHEEFESPAAIDIWIQNKSILVSYTKLYLNEKLSASTEDFDALIIMGWPQSPSTTLQECPHFDGKKEIDFIRTAIKKEKKVLGVCLGAQMIGEALGGICERSPEREIGVFETYLTETWKKDPYISHIPEEFLVGHWHGDMPWLTDTAEILAYSRWCPRQIIKYTEKVYGFQCHFEFTTESINAMIENSWEELAKYSALTYVQDPQTLRNNVYQEMNQYLFDFLDEFIK